VIYVVLTLVFPAASRTVLLPAALAPDDLDTFIIQLSKLNYHDFDTTGRCPKSIVALSHWPPLCRCELVRVILYSYLPPRPGGQHLHGYTVFTAVRLFKLAR
jgi:hypothetical protein